MICCKFLPKVVQFRSNIQKEKQQRQSRSDVRLDPKRKYNVLKKHFGIIGTWIRQSKNEVWKWLMRLKQNSAEKTKTTKAKSKSKNECIEIRFEILFHFLHLPIFRFGKNNPIINEQSTEAIKIP